MRGGLPTAHPDRRWPMPNLFSPMTQVRKSVIQPDYDERQKQQLLQDVQTLKSQVAALEYLMNTLIRASPREFVEATELVRHPDRYQGWLVTVNSPNFPRP